MKLNAAEIDRFQKFVLQGENRCLLWTGCKTHDGYARFYWHGKQRIASRLWFQHVKGSIPEDRQLDHLCRVRHCVNPNHLEIVTGHENLVRGNGWAAHNARKTVCKRGHALEKHYQNPRWRWCRTCYQAQDREKKRRAYAMERMV